MDNRNSQLPAAPSNESDYQDYRSIPDVLISRETLLFLGFTPLMANEIWRRWITWDDDGREVDGGPVTFDSMYRAQISSATPDAFTDDNQCWIREMNEIGITEALQATIMTPYYKDIRLTRSCQYWLKYLMDGRYEALREMQAVSGESTSASQDGSARSNLPRCRHNLEPRHPSTLDYSITKFQATNPDHTILYMAGTLTFLKRAFDDDGRLSYPGRLCCYSLGDFYKHAVGISFMKDYNITKKYAMWTKRLVGNQPSGILRIEIPNGALGSLYSSEKLDLYWPSQLWKDTVWICRGNRRLCGDLLRVKESTLTVGTVCGKPDVAIDGLPTSEHITEEMILRNPDGEFAVQYVFLSDPGEIFLEDHCADLARILTLSTAEVECLEREEIRVGPGS